MLVQLLRDLQEHFRKRSVLSADTLPVRLGTDLLLFALLEVCVAAVGTVYANGVLDRFAGDGYLDISLTVVAVASVICMGISLLALWRWRRRNAAACRRIYLALVAHGVLSIPGLGLIWQFFRA
jgi:ABC-type spermidine/putrescine transport system permease subunit II